MKFDINSPITSNPILAFVIGLLAVFPSMAPTALSLKAKPELEMYRKADFETKFLWIPVGYGFLSMAIFYFANLLLPKGWRTYWVIGIIMGLIYPTFGTVGGYAKKVYGITSTPMLYVNAQIMYIIFYGLIINFIATNIC